MQHSRRYCTFQDIIQVIKVVKTDCCYYPSVTNRHAPLPRLDSCLCINSRPPMKEFDSQLDLCSADWLFIELCAGKIAFK